MLDSQDKHNIHDEPDEYYVEYLEFLAKRIGTLRTTKNVSAREVSLAISQDEGYVGKIERKKFLPSMTNFLKICDYFNISPKDFFDDGIKFPEKLQSILEDMKTLTDEQLANIGGVVSAIAKK